ncbi:MAG: hypothetical protein ISS52_04075, partial [Dehalococcoidia bacterium]|nr:hypothetical protein [Dehalococcoidia bacterium]
MLRRNTLPIIIRDVKVRQLHSWQMTIAQAQQIQRKLASQVSQKNEVTNPRFVAGVDISAPNPTGLARAAAVVLCHPQLDVAEVQVAE